MSFAQTVSIRYVDALPTNANPLLRSDAMVYVQGDGLYFCSGVNEWTRITGIAELMVLGVVMLSKAPDDPMEPIAIGVNEKGQPLGVAPLGADGKIDPAYISSLTNHNFVPVASQAERLALSSTAVQPGDEVIEVDTGKTYVLVAANPALVGSWILVSDVSPEWSVISGRPNIVTNGSGELFLTNDGTYKAVSVSDGGETISFVSGEPILSGGVFSLS